MSRPKHVNHVHFTLHPVPPPPKTWQTPTYHLDHYTVRRHVRVVNVQLHGEHGNEKRTESISLPLLPGVTDTEIVRAAVWFSPHKWTVSSGMNVSQFQGHFSRPVDERLLQTFMNPPKSSSSRRQPSPQHAPTPAETSSFQQPPQPAFLPPGQVPALPHQYSYSPASFYSQPTQMYPTGQFQPTAWNSQSSQTNPGQVQPPNPYPQAGQFSPPHLPPMQPPPKRIRSPWIVIGLLVGAIVLCGGIATALSSTGANTSQSIVPTSAPTQHFSQAPTRSATATPLPTQRPTPTPTPKPQATATPTPKPVVYVTAKPNPTPTSCPGINCNPWGYNFTPGHLIDPPPSGFCNYFQSIPTFYAPDDPGDGYIVQCVDGSYSQSGGESGTCSYHGGVSRPLYSH